MENHHFPWENPLFLWPFSIAMLVHQRVHITKRNAGIPSHVSVMDKRRLSGTSVTFSAGPLTKIQKS